MARITHMALRFIAMVGQKLGVLISRLEGKKGYRGCTVVEAMSSDKCSVVCFGKYKAGKRP